MEDSKDQRRAQIIQATIETLKLYGLKKMTLDDIASRLGMSATAIYYYFANRDELIHAAITQVAISSMEECEAVMHLPISPEEKLVSAWKIAFKMLKENPFLLTMIESERFSKVSMLSKEIHSDILRRYNDLVKRVLVEGVEKGDFVVENIDLTALLISHGFAGIIMMTGGEPEFAEIEAQIDELPSILFDGIRRRPAASTPCGLP